MARKTYPGDIAREQFEYIRPLLESVRKQTKPRTLDLHDVFCAVLYLLKSGCQWRMLPSDFPKWRSVHAYFQIWSAAKDGQPSILEHVLKNWLARSDEATVGPRPRVFSFLTPRVSRIPIRPRRKATTPVRKCRALSDTSPWTPMGCPTLSTSPRPP